MKITIAVLMIFGVDSLASGVVSAQTAVPPLDAPPPASGHPALAVPGTPGSGPSFSLLGGLSLLSFVAQAEVAYGGASLAVGAGVGTVDQPLLEANLGYRIPLGRSRWAIQSGFRFSRMWEQARGCVDVCRFDFFLGEVAIRYVGRDGFTFQYGLPLFGWTPVGPDAGQTQPRLEGFVLQPEIMSFLQTVMIGWSHAF